MVLLHPKVIKTITDRKSYDKYTYEQKRTLYFDLYYKLQKRNPKLVEGLPDPIEFAGVLRIGMEAGLGEAGAIEAGAVEGAELGAVPGAPLGDVTNEDHGIGGNIARAIFTGPQVLRAAQDALGITEAKEEERERAQQRQQARETELTDALVEARARAHGALNQNIGGRVTLIKTVMEKLLTHQQAMTGATRAEMRWILRDDITLQLVLDAFSKYGIEFEKGGNKTAVNAKAKKIVDYIMANNDIAAPLKNDLNEALREDALQHIDAWNRNFPNRDLNIVFPRPTEAMGAPVQPPEKLPALPQVPALGQEEKYDPAEHPESDYLAGELQRIAMNPLDAHRFATSLLEMVREGLEEEIRQTGELRGPIETAIKINENALISAIQTIKEEHRKGAVSDTVFDTLTEFFKATHLPQKASEKIVSALRDVYKINVERMTTSKKASDILQDISTRQSAVYDRQISQTYANLQDAFGSAIISGPGLAQAQERLQEDLQDVFLGDGSYSDEYFSDSYSSDFDSEDDIVVWGSLSDEDNELVRSIRSGYRWSLDRITDNEGNSVMRIRVRGREWRGSVKQLIKILLSAGGGTAIAVKAFSKKVKHKKYGGFPGENHAILFSKDNPTEPELANFMGPGTNIIARLKRGDVGKTPADEVAKLHDVLYLLAAVTSKTKKEQLEKVREADVLMLKQLKEIEKAGTDTKWNIQLGYKLIDAKIKLEDSGVLSPSRYAGKLDKIPPEDVKLLETTRDSLLKKTPSELIPTTPEKDIDTDIDNDKPTPDDKPTMPDDKPTTETMPDGGDDAIAQALGTAVSIPSEMKPTSIDVGRRHTPKGNVFMKLPMNPAHVKQYRLRGVYDLVVKYNKKVDEINKQEAKEEAVKKWARAEGRLVKEGTELTRADFDALDQLGERINEKLKSGTQYDVRDPENVAQEMFKNISESLDLNKEHSSALQDLREAYDANESAEVIGELETRVNDVQALIDKRSAEMGLLETELAPTSFLTDITKEVLPASTDEAIAFKRVQLLESQLDPKSVDFYNQQMTYEQNQLGSFPSKLEYYKHREQLLSTLYVLGKQQPPEGLDDIGKVHDAVQLAGVDRIDHKDEDINDSLAPEQLVGGDAPLLTSTAAEERAEQKRVEDFSYVPPNHYNGTTSNPLYREHIRDEHMRFAPLQVPDRHHREWREPAMKRHYQPRWYSTYQIDDRFDNEYDNTVFGFQPVMAKSNNQLLPSTFTFEPERNLMLSNVGPTRIPQMRTDRLRFADFNYDKRVEPQTYRNKSAESGVAMDYLQFPNQWGFPRRKQLDSFDYQMAKK